MTKTQDVIPSWLPVINFKMVAALEHTLGWGALYPVLERFQKTQCPTVNRVDAPAVLQIVMGIGQVDRKTVCVSCRLRGRKTAGQN
jgi:hypothetical protein